MSDRIEPTSADLATGTTRRGQTMVEFALLLPMLVVLFLGIADFARAFQAGIVTEAAARNGAEVAALERLRVKPPPTSDPGFTGYYQRLHDIAAQATCAEARTLPNATYVSDDPNTSAPDDDICPTMPAIGVCVRDGQDPLCGALATGYTGPLPPQCSELTRAWDGASGGGIASHSIEVRVCYRFTTMVSLDFSLPLGWGLSLGDVWLQRSRTFVVDCPPGPDVTGC